MPEPGRQTRLFLTAAGVLLAAAAMGQFGKAPHATGGFLFAYALGFIPYAWAVRISTKPGGAPPFAMVLGVALLLRLLVSPTLPSDDLNRYAWEGRIQSEGVNPYLVAPDDPRLAALRDEVWPGINHPDLPAIYPPAAQLSFRLFARAGLGLRDIKGVMAGLDLCVIAALGLLLRSRGMPAGRALIYAWSPLAVFQVGGRGHMEPLLLLPMLLAAALLARRASGGHRALGGALLAAGFMARWNALPLGISWIRSLRGPGLLAAGLTALLLAGPYADAGFGLLETLRRFYTDFHFADSLNALAVGALGQGGGRILCGAVLLGVTLFLMFREHDPAKSARLFFGASILLLPTVHPWYFLWVLPWLALGRPWGWIVLTATVPLYADGLVVAAGGWENLREHAGWKALAYGAGAMVWAGEWLRDFRARGSGEAGQGRPSTPRRGEPLS